MAALHVPVVFVLRTQVPPPEHAVIAPLMRPHGLPAVARDTFAQVPVVWPVAIWHSRPATLSHVPCEHEAPASSGAAHLVPLHTSVPSHGCAVVSQSAPVAAGCAQAPGVGVDESAPTHTEPYAQSSFP